ncbi:DUF4179 domain-containing protein [Metabacillus idriensis]|uniref:DUF4179 domain-containing protein n=1 Tax=Metabacillus idriensis TaxID=324768 RepID=UPI00203BA56B|nr:DUF4179 domain-containing protein [Metabacillus idriensis]MCM3594882.1 DUF4179 domain-containing protein [Metabacillus idriensis]
MDKKWFENQMAEMELPEDEVFAAVSRGIKAGKEQKRKKSRYSVKSAALFSTAAATILLASGFIFSPVTNVLASVPLLGSIYENFSFSIGKELASAELVTELNKKAASNGVSITLTSVYFDGNVVGVTFRAEGDSLPEKWVEGPNDPASGYGHYLFDGSESKQWPGSHSGIVKTEDGYLGSMEFYYQGKELPADFTLPLTFESIAGQKGEWKFDVPVWRISNETAAVNAETKIGDEKLVIHSVTKGKATTLLEYETVLSDEHDSVSFRVKDGQGNELPLSHGDVIHSEVINGKVHTVQRYLFSAGLSDETEYLMVYPEIERDEPRTLAPVVSPPFTAESKRFGYELQVDKVTKKDNRVVLDYRIKHVNGADYKQDILQNFADSISLQKGDTFIYGNNAKLIDPESLHFQSNFNVTADVDLNDFSLSIPFGFFSMNGEPVKLPPVKVELK